MAIFPTALAAESDHAIVTFDETAISDQLTLHYQPIINLASNDVVAHEGLLRWDHPTAGLIAPGDFLPQAELSGLIEGIGSWTSRAACQQSRAWLDGGCPGRVAINVSPSQLVSGAFVNDVGAALLDAGVDPSELILEITENALIADMDCVIATMNTLQPIGVAFALDDFGTGYSSLAHLSSVKFDYIKLDRTFIAKLDYDHRAVALLNGLVRLCEAIEVETIAEGIETTTQRDRVHQLGVTLAQGFLIGSPGPIESN